MSQSNIVRSLESIREATESGYVEPYERILMGHSKLKPWEWAVDDLVLFNVAMISGWRAVGKTSLITTLAFVTAGLLEFDGIKTKRWRRVLISTEDPEQIDRIIYGIKKRHRINHDDIDDRIAVVPARRGTLVDFTRLANQFQHLVYHDGVKDRYPLFIDDTLSANHKMSDENNNAAGADVVDVLKKAFPRWGIWCVHHIAKENRNQKAENQTSRGAGSFEGNTQATYVIARQNPDDKHSDSFMTTTKTRGRLNLEIGCRLRWETEEIEDDYGETVASDYPICDLYLTDSEEREKLVAEYKETYYEPMKSECIDLLVRHFTQLGKSLPQRAAKEWLRDQGHKASNDKMIHWVNEAKRVYEYQVATQGE